MRILRNGADWPRITVRYTLQRHGQTLRQGEETIADMDYLHRGVLQPNEPLVHEKRMLEAWFRLRFGRPQANHGG